MVGGGRSSSGARHLLVDLLQRQLGDRLQRLEDAEPVERRRLEVACGPARFSVSSRFSMGSVVRRSRLLYWNTSGTRSSVRPISRRLSSRLRSDSTFASSAASWRVGHEDDAVHAAQHQLAGGVVEDLAGHRVELDADPHAADDADLEGQQVEEERAVGVGLEAHHLAARHRRRLLVDVQEVRGLAAEARDRNTRSWPTSASSCS